MFEVILPKTVQKQLDKLPNDIWQEILPVLERLATQPFPIGFKKLRNFRLGEYRIRFGNYRVIYDVDQDKEQILIVRVMHRREVYRLS